MQFTIVKEDNFVEVDGEALNFEFTVPANVWAVHWGGDAGTVEYDNGNNPVEITDMSEFKNVVDAHATEKQRLADEVTQAEADRITNLTYADYREAEYPPAEDYLDGIVKGDTAQVDKYVADCLAVKAKYPKP